MTRAPVIAQRLALSALLALSLASATAHAKPFGITKVRTKRGAARLVVAPRATELSSLVIRCAAGSCEDGIRAGATRLAQRAMIDCNKREPDGAFRRDLYAAAGELEIETGVRESAFVLLAPRASFDDLAQRLLALVMDPDIDARAFARCRTLALRDTLAYGSRGDLEARMAGALFLAPRGSPNGADFRNPPYGDPDVIKKLKPKAIDRHIGRWLAPSNATVIATGRVNVAGLKAALAKHRGGKRNVVRRLAPSGELPTTLRAFAAREVGYHAQLVTLVNAEQTAAARVLAAILEERLSAGVSARAQVFVLARPWGAAVVVELPGGDGIEDVRAAVEALADGRFGDDEMTRNLDFVRRALGRVDAQPRPLARALQRGVDAGDWHSAKVVDALDGMTEAKFLSVAREWLRPDRGVSARFGPENERAEGQR
jgi:predicted Zn-dependent peptidase